MTTTNIRIMEESAENKTFERVIKGSVCTNRSDRSAWRCAAQLHGTVWLDLDKPVGPVAKTDQTGLHLETQKLSVLRLG